MQTVSILFAGVGGQGIVLASRIVARCAFSAGYTVKESELHGMSQRGGSVISHVRFGDVVYSPLIPKGKAGFLVALEELEGLRYSYYLKPKGIVILNEKRVMPATVNPDTNPYPEDVKARLIGMGFQVDTLNALEVSKELGNPKVENIIVLGLLSQHLPMPLSAWEKTIHDSVPPRTLEINLKSFERGREIYRAFRMSR
jgi:indolepyruvate ferredoxin oxidoreductase, beta subunit